MPEFNIIYTGLLIAAVVGGVLGVVAYLTLAERKISAWVQDRIGPNRVGPLGMLQPLVDGGKFFLKEDVIPRHVDRVFFILAPVVAFATALLGIAVVPLGHTTPPPGPVPSNDVAGYIRAQEAYQAAGFNYMVSPGLDIGMLYTFAIGSLAVYGVILAGWSSDNKYSLLGSLRSSAQIISYEIPLGMSIIGVILVTGQNGLNLETIIAKQAGNHWNLFYQPLAFLLFFVAVGAECSRLPFDLPESEQELVGGYHTEYSSLKLGMLLLAEYAHLITTCFMLSVVFLGGWQLFGLENVAGTDGVGPVVVRLGILVGKMLFFVFLFMMIRWTIPRFRFDQLMSLAWKVMIPLALLNLICVLVVKQYGLPLWSLTIASVVLFVGAGAVALVTGGSVTAPRRKVRKLPPGLPAEVTFAGR